MRIKNETTFFTVLTLFFSFPCDRERSGKANIIITLQGRKQDPQIVKKSPLYHFWSEAVSQISLLEDIYSHCLSQTTLGIPGTALRLQWWAPKTLAYSYYIEESMLSDHISACSLYKLQGKSRAKTAEEGNIFNISLTGLTCAT